MSGPLPGYLAPLAAPAAWMYERIVEMRNRRCDQGTGVKRLNVPVLSVGNITTGGTGKTPMVMWIANVLRENDVHPAIAMRGYGATGEHPSDEAIEYAERLPDVPLIVNPDRVSACRAHLAEHPETDCIILDDGFQHRRLFRDLDLVLIDATRDLARERMIPAGHLREPLRNLARADAVVITRANLAEESHVASLNSQIETHHGKPPLAISSHTWSSLHIFTHTADSRVAAARGSDQPAQPDHQSPQYRKTDLSWLQGKRIVTLLGVGNPRSIIAQLEQAGATVAADVPAGDHERFTPAKLAVTKGLCDGLTYDTGGLVMTAKDWARSRDLIDLQHWPCPIIVPELEIEIAEGRAALEGMILNVMKEHLR